MASIWLLVFDDLSNRTITRAMAGSKMKAIFRTLSLPAAYLEWNTRVIGPNLQASAKLTTPGSPVIAY